MDSINGDYWTSGLSLSISLCTLRPAIVCVDPPVQCPLVQRVIVDLLQCMVRAFNCFIYTLSTHTLTFTGSNSEPMNLRTPQICFFFPLRQRFRFFSWPHNVSSGLLSLLPYAWAAPCRRRRQGPVDVSVLANAHSQEEPKLSIQYLCRLMRKHCQLLSVDDFLLHLFWPGEGWVHFSLNISIVYS